MKRTVDYLLGVPIVSALRLLKRKKTKPPRDVRSILVVKLAAAGDTILMVPFLRALRDRFKEAEIHWLVSPINGSLAKTIPYVDRVWTLRSFRWPDIKKTVRDLSSRRFDLVFDLEQWARGTAILSYWIGGRYVVGFNTPGQHKHGLFDKAVPKKFDRHEKDEFLSVLDGIVGNRAGGSLELWETETGKKEWDQSVPAEWKRAAFKVLIHPGCGRDGTPREWPLANYAVLGNWLINRYGASIFISGGPDEKRKGDALHRFLNRKALNLAGSLGWEGALTLVNKMDLVLSGNTGLMHVAAAFGKKQVALHGPTDPKLWGPLNENARVLQSSCPRCPSLKLGFEYHRRDQSCMGKIPLESVKKTVESLIDNQPRI